LHAVGDKSVILESLRSIQNVKFSSDNCISFNAGIILPPEFDIKKARILENGNIVLFGCNQMYYSVDNLLTIHPCIVIDKNGLTYSYHMPVNSEYPGGYFYFMGGFIENSGVCVLGNYTNSSMGSSPVNLYYSLDGITWKVFYTFGQNPDYTDNGTRGGGIGGSLLGDPNNSIITRHIHAINIGGDGNFYVCTGDSSESMHFLKCSYNRTKNNWVISDLLKENSLSWQRMRALGVFERNGYLYWGSDGRGTFSLRGVTYESLGIYKCSVSDINNPSRHILLQSLTDSCYSFLNIDNIVLAGLQNSSRIYLSFDYGETWSFFKKPIYMTGSVEGVWYNKKYEYFGTHKSGFKLNKVKIEPTNSQEK